MRKVIQTEPNSYSVPSDLLTLKCPNGCTYELFKKTLDGDPFLCYDKREKTFSVYIGYTYDTYNQKEEWMCMECGETIILGGDIVE